MPRGDTTGVKPLTFMQNADEGSATVLEAHALEYLFYDIR